MSKIAAYNCRAEEESKLDIHAHLLDYNKTCLSDKHMNLAHTSRMTELSGKLPCGNVLIIYNVIVIEQIVAIM